MAPSSCVSNMIIGYWHSQAVCVAAELGIADLLTAEGPQTAEGLAQGLKVDAASLYRLLRALASNGIFAEQSDGKFAMTDAAESLRDGIPGSQRAMARMVLDNHYQAFGELMHSIKTGETGFDKVFGMPCFDYLTKNPDSGKIFDAAMTDIHGRETAPMIAALDLANVTHLVDIGGGNGSLIIEALRQNPHLKGTIYDLEPVIERARENIRAAGLEDRCELVAGNFFLSVPEGADAYIMRHIIHDWDDARCGMILSHCRNSMKPGGRVLVAESVIEPGNTPDFAKWLDLVMLVIPGGKERTAEEYRALFAASGLSLKQIIPTNAGISILEAVVA